MRSPVYSALLITALALPTGLCGQGVTVQSVSDVRLTGALGAAANIAAKFGGGSMQDIVTTSYLSGHRMRVESAISGAIIDADAGRIISIDHKQKSYSSMTFAEMATAMQQATQSTKQSATKGNTKDPKTTDDELKVTYKVAVDRPGQREKISGYDAERMFITITLEGEVASEGKKDEAVGSMVFLMDQWISKDSPQIAALREFQRAYAQKVGQEFREQTQGLQAAMSGDPRLKGGFEAAAKELAKVPGIALRSVTHVVLVPVGVEFNRQTTLGDGVAAARESAAKKDEKPSGGGLRGMMGALKTAADNASKQEKQTDKQSAPAKQTTLMTVANEVKSITRGEVSADMFAPPAGYRERKP